MSKLRRIAAVLIACILGISFVPFPLAMAQAPTVPNVAQTNLTGASAISSTTISLTVANAGDAVILALNWYEGSTNTLTSMLPSTLSIAGTLGDTSYTYDVGAGGLPVGGGANCQATNCNTGSIWIAKATSSGTDTITITFPSSKHWGGTFAALDVVSLGTLVPNDVERKACENNCSAVNTFNTASTSAVSTATISVSAFSFPLNSYCGAAGGQFLSPGGSYSFVIPGGGGQSGVEGCQGYWIATSTTTTNYPYTIVGSGNTEASYSLAGATFTSIPPTVTLPFICGLSSQALLVGATEPIVSFTGGSPSPSPSTATCGSTTNLTVQSSTTITASLPADGAHTRYRSPSALTDLSCASGTCSAFTITAYLECQVSASINDLDTGAWGSGLSFPVLGTSQGQSGTLGAITPTGGSYAKASTTIWPDCGVAYNYPGKETDSSGTIWVTSEAITLTENIGGSSRTIDYLTQGGTSNANLGGTGGNQVIPSQSTGPSFPNPLTDPLGFLAAIPGAIYSLISSNIILFPLILLFLLILSYLFIKQTRDRKGARG